MELIVDPLLPAFGQLSARVQILGKKTIFMRDALKIEHSLDHVEMRHQHRLCNVGGKFLVMLGNARKKAWSRLAQALPIELIQVKAQFNALVKLESLQFPNGDTAENLFELGLSQRQENVGKLHLFEVNIPLVQGDRAAALQLKVLGLMMEFLNTIADGRTNE